MGRLSETVEQQRDKYKDRPNVPEWMPLLGMVGGVVFAVALLWNLFGPAPEANLDQMAVDAAQQTLAQQRADSVPDPVDVPTSGPSGSETDVPTEGPTVDEDGAVQLPDEQGFTVTVPGEAVEVATAGMMATYTGDFGGVALPDGVAEPQLSTTFPDATVESPTVVSRSSDGSELTLSFQVDPDGAGRLLPRRATATTVSSTSGWVFLP